MMFSIVRKMLAIGKALAPDHIARDADPNTPPMAFSTRQRFLATTESLKGVATCCPTALHVTVTSAPPAVVVLAFIQHRDPLIVPIFVATYTTAEVNVLAAINIPATPEIVRATRPWARAPINSRVS
jgi:hypothetical protein